MKQYSFVTDWYLDVPLKDAWDTIYHSLDWPLWWENVKSVTETRPGDDRGLGSIREYVMQTTFLYSLKFSLLLTERVEYAHLTGVADGDLIGTGSWYFYEKDGITHVQCRWNVSTSIWWMNTFAFVLKPLFSYNHNLVMKKGGENLARKLNAQLLSQK